MDQCKCRDYGKNAEEGAMTVKMKDGKAFCPRCGGHIDYEKGNIVALHSRREHGRD